MNISFKKEIFQINNEHTFFTLAFKLFNYQYINNPIYKKYVNLIKVDINNVQNIEQIPFLPIEFFKNHKIITGHRKIEKTFLSSGTTSSIRSIHYVMNLSIYKESLIKGFEYFYGHLKNYCIFALIPPYEENPKSSLSFMVNEFIKKSKNINSGFYFNKPNILLDLLLNYKPSRQGGTNYKPIILIGLSFALLDFAKKYKSELSKIPAVGKKNLIIIETGGMKGKRKPARMSQACGEITREELHKILCSAFHIKNIHSEYGMTELLSQAYSKADGIFYTSPWMKVLIRDINDPFNIKSKVKSQKSKNNTTGAINIIDLANINSCAFIATNDIGRLHSDGGFEVLGRLDDADIRGCNLMIDV